MTVVGDTLLDVVARPDRPPRAGDDVTGDVRVAPGGQGANVAVRLARRGRRVRLVTGIGDDAAGRLLRDALAADGVDLVVGPVGASGAVLALVDEAGERSMISRRPSLLDAVGEETWDSATGWIVVSGYLLTEPGAASVAASLATRPARRALVGCAVSTEGAAAWQTAARALRPDVVVLNREEWARTPVEGETLTVVTGPDGARATLGDASFEVAAPGQPGAAVDTTGAGDAFAGVLLDALADRWPPDADALRDALQTALGVAREVTRTVGAQARVDSEGGAGMRT